MTHPLTPREKVAVFETCPGCGADEPRNRCLGCCHDFAPINCQASLDSSPDAALASSGDHAELARLAEAATRGPWEACSTYDRYASVRLPNGPNCRSGKKKLLTMARTLNSVSGAQAAADAAFIAAANPATVLALLAENAALRGERDRIAGESIWWKGVIGDGSHQPSGEVRSIKHLHPAMVKPIYEANKGTAVADVIAGLIFSLAITENREQFLVADANERRLEAERKLAEAEEWRPIETAPHETLVVLGWFEEGVWKQDLGLASAGQRWPTGASNMWWHGSATHWLPLPPAPGAEA